VNDLIESYLKPMLASRPLTPKCRLADFKRVRRVSALNEFTIAAVIVNAHQTGQSACHRDLTRVTVTPWQICCRKICHK